MHQPDIDSARHVVETTHRSPVAQRAFTLVELMVVVVIAMVLAGLLGVILASMNSDTGTHRNHSCGNNQRQIVLAMGVYANENDGVWPYRPTDKNGYYNPVHPDAYATTCATFEFVLVQTGNQMTAKVFACPSSPACHPDIAGGEHAANPALDETGDTHSNWMAYGSANALKMPGYCYDWSVPTNANASRVVTADRGFDTMGHKSVVIVCYADNHVGNLKQTLKTAPKAPFTYPFGSNATPASVYYNTDANGTTPDNIYDCAGDDLNEFLGGVGSTTRAWVR